MTQSVKKSTKGTDGNIKMNSAPSDRLCKNDEIVSQLNANDVLFGRGSGPNDHEGNIRFRSLVSERKSEYMATNHRQTKAKIAREIVDAVLNKNGRFLKKLEGAEAKRRGVQKGTDAWIIADDETIMEKAKQALRQHRDKDKSPRSSPVPAKSTVPPPVKLENYSTGIPAPPYVSSGASRSHSPPRSAVAGASSLRTSGSIMGGVPGYPAYSVPMQPNPYEPIPLRVDPHGPHGYQAQWSEYAAAAVAAQAPNYHPQPAYSSTAMSAQSMSFDSMPPPAAMAPGGSRRESIQVHDLMDSFGKLKTKESNHGGGHNDSSDSLSRNQESTDTMGTIEPLPMQNSKEGYGPSMSMSSGTFSMMKSALADSSAKSSFTSQGANSALMKLADASAAAVVADDKVSPMSATSGNLPASSGVNATEAPAAGADTRRGDRSSIYIDDKGFFPGSAARRASSQNVDNMSLSLSQVWSAPARSSFAAQAISEESEDRMGRSTGAQQGKKKLPDGQDPRALGLMEEDPDNMSSLGKSSMSILNIAMGEDSGLTTAHESVFSDLGE